jgi:ankyrin repeat protein
VSRIIEETTGYELTALSVAAIWGQAEVVKVLLEFNAQVDPTDSQHRLSPLTLAASWGRPAVVKLLLDAQADVNYASNYSDKTGARPLSFAVKCGRHAPEVVKLLLEANAEVNYTGAGSTPLIDAAASGDDSRIIKLLLDAGADVDRRDEKGKTALHYAISKQYLKSVKLLAATASHDCVDEAEEELEGEM